MARNYDLYLNIFRERNQLYLSLNPTIMKIVNFDILLVCIKNLITIKKTKIIIYRCSCTKTVLLFRETTDGNQSRLICRDSFDRFLASIDGETENRSELTQRIMIVDLSVHCCKLNRDSLTAVPEYQQLAIA